MTIATRNDILHAFPGLEDHALVEVLAMQATVNELEAALSVLSSDDQDLIDVRRRDGDRIHRLLAILDSAGIEAPIESRDST